MARFTSVRQIWAFILGYGGSLAALILGSMTSERMLSAHPHPATGYAMAAVAIGAFSLVPIIALIAWMFRRSDEYERQGLLLTSTIAFGVVLVVMAALDSLAQTDLLSGWVWSPRWWTVVACWMIALVAVRFFRDRAA